MLLLAIQWSDSISTFRGHLPVIHCDSRDEQDRGQLHITSTRQDDFKGFEWLWGDLIKFKFANLIFEVKILRSLLKVIFWISQGSSDDW